MGSSTWINKLQLYVALVIMQLSFAEFEILTRNLLVGGFSPFVFPVYRNAIAFFALAPVAYFLERENRPKLETRHLPVLLALGTIGIFCNQITYVLGLWYTSASFTSAYRNSLPVFAFLLAYFMGIEKLSISKREGQAKLMATGLGVGGATIMVLYRGPQVVEPYPGNHLKLLGTWHLGVLILTVSNITFAFFLIVQAKFMKTYPAPFSIATISIGIGCVELALFAALVDTQLSRWTLNSASVAFAVVYAGLVASGLVSAIQSWGIKRGGPVIVAATQPLETVAVAVLSFIFLKEGFNLGSLIGALIVIAGLYFLIWSQSREKNLKDLTSLKEPLLVINDAA